MCKYGMIAEIYRLMMNKLTVDSVVLLVCLSYNEQNYTRMSIIAVSQFLWFNDGIRPYNYENDIL